MQEVVPKEARKFEVGEGSGDKLGDCARSKSNTAGVCIEINFPWFFFFFNYQDAKLIANDLF